MANPQTGNFGVVDVTFTSTQLQALATSPQTILPSPGSGLFICLQQVMWLYTFGSQAFNGGIPALQLNSTNIVDCGDFIGATSNTVEVDRPTFANQRTVFDNQALIFTASSNSTQGDGSMRVRIYYSIEPSN